MTNGSQLGLELDSRTEEYTQRQNYTESQILPPPENPNVEHKPRLIPLPTPTDPNGRYTVQDLLRSEAVSAVERILGPETRILEVELAEG
jgi:hypothetical protein